MLSSLIVRLRTACYNVWQRLTGRRKAAPLAPTPKPVPTAAEVKRVHTRRDNLVTLLRRIDHGGKHYGSKRRDSNHRGSQRGKRSGRS